MLARLIRIHGVLLAAVALSASACSAQPPTVYPIVGPDGSRMLHVSCGSDQGRCFRIAGQACPTGYEFHAIGDVVAGNFLVRCRYYYAAAAPNYVQPLPASGMPASDPSAAPTGSSASAPDSVDAWPPRGDVDLPSRHPWAPESAADAAASSAQPAAGSNSSSGFPIETDIGY